MSTLWRDLRYSIRLLLKTPGFSLTAVLVLALGIGVNAAVFSLVNAMLFKPAAGADRPGELVGIYSQDRTRPDSYRAFSYPELQDLRRRATVFSDVTGFNAAFVGIGEGEATRRTMVAVVPANYFSTLGAELMAGRNFTPDEERPGSGATVAIVSHAFWKARGSDPALLGQTIRINARPFTVIGVAPPGFTGTSILVGMEAWLPLGANELVETLSDPAAPRSLADRRRQSLMLAGRLRPGVTQEAAAPALRALSAALEREYPAESRNQLITTHTLSRASVSTEPQDDSDVYAPFSILMGMAVIVLVIASLNLANMMLARGTVRRKEIAMRLALGGGRGRVIRQLLTEGAVLSSAGGVAGLVLGYWGATLLVRSLVPLSPVPIAIDPSPDVRVALATLGFCALTTLVFALGPAWKLSRTDVIAQIKEQEGEPVAGGWRRRFGARNLLVATQLALSLGLLTAAGLFTRGAFEAGRANPGYRFDGQLVASIDASLAGYDETRGRETYGRLLDRLRALPGVRAASLSSTVAFGGFTEGTTVLKAGATAVSRDGRPAGTRVVSYSIGTGYFGTLRIPILRGRDFTEAEAANTDPPAVVIIDEPAARALFPGEEPVGQHIRYARDEEQQPVQGAGVVVDGPAATPRTMMVIGVVTGLRHNLFDRAPVAHLYLPFGGAYRTTAHLHVAIAGAGERAEAAALQAVRREIAGVDERLPVLGLQTLDRHRATSILYWIVRAGANIFLVFGGVAAFLAVVGLYAVKAYVVSRRTREIGIRMALGSSERGVLWLVLREGAGLTAAGLAGGILIALGIGQLVGSMLYRVSPFDPQVLGLAALLLAGAALVASYLPARRATRVAPMQALRTE